MNKKTVYGSIGLGLMVALTFSPVSSALAEEIDEIVVSATGIPTPLAQIGASVDVITAEDLERQQITYLQDALATVAGVSAYSSGGPGTKSNVFLRGTGGEYTAVLVDGIQINNPYDQNVNWTHLPTHGLETIEILRGSQSVMYGSEAIGGAVNAYTAVGGDTKFKAMADLGSFGTQRLVGSARGERNRIAYGASVETVSIDGFSISDIADADDNSLEDDGYEKTSVRFRVKADINRDFSADFAYRMIASETDTDVDPNPFANVPRDNPSSYEDFDALGMRLKLNYAGDRFSQSVSYGSAEDENKSGSGTNKGERNVLSYRGTLDFSDSMQFFIGADRDLETYTAGANEYEASNLAGYTVIQLHNDGLSATIAARRDDHEEFGIFDTYRVSALVDLETFAVRATYGTGFRAPSLNELFDVVYNSGNPDLQPEESAGGDLGIEFRVGDQSKIEAAYFFSTITDLIVFDSNFRNINSDGDSKSSGIEIRGETVLLGDYSVSGNYTYLISKDVDDNRQIRQPRHTLNLALTTDINERLSIAGSMRIVRDTIDSDFSQPWPYPKVALEDYTLVNLNTAYQLNDGIKAIVQVENLLDEDYESALDFATPGRAFYVGVTSSF